MLVLGLRRVVFTSSTPGGAEGGSFSMQIIKLLRSRDEGVGQAFLDGNLQKACMLLLLHDLADSEGMVRIGTDQLSRLFNEQLDELLERAVQIATDWAESSGRRFCAEEIATRYETASLSPSEYTRKLFLVPEHED